MLHGYTQSGPLFQAKTGALRKTLQKAFPAGCDLVYRLPTKHSSQRKRKRARKLMRGRGGAEKEQGSRIHTKALNSGWARLQKF
jgi:hypothetical protein